LNRIDHRDGEGYQSIFENASEGIFQSSLDGRFLKVNPAMARIYGYDSPEDMLISIKNIGKQIYVNAKERESILNELLVNGHIDKFVCQNYRKDGSIFWTLTNARIVRDMEGNALYIEGFITDITSRKEAQLALRASEERYRALVERLPAVIFLDATNEIQTTLYISPKIKELLGYTPEEWIADPFIWENSLHPDDKEHVIADDERTNTKRGNFSAEYRLRKKDGKYTWIREEATLILDYKGKPLKWQGFLFDISTQKQAESAIQQSEEHFKKIFQANPIASCIATLKEGRFIAANDAYWKLSGFEPNEILGHTSVELGFLTRKGRKNFVTRLKKEKSLHNESGKLITKSKELPADIEWHMIGHLQSNKVRYISPFISLIHSVDSMKLLEVINNEGQKIKRVIDVLFQMHIAEEETKYGLDKEKLNRLLLSPEYLSFKNIKVRGLMGMATFTRDEDKIRSEFKNLVKIFKETKESFFRNKDYFSEISMGMSNDYKIAVEEGATIIRIGSLIFGERKY